MHPIRLLRTVGFRLAALYASLFSLSVLVLFGIVYWVASEALVRQVMDNIRSEADALTEDFRHGGLPILIQSIQQRLESERHSMNVYLLTDPAGDRIVGNLPAIDFVSGWRELPSLPATAKTAADYREDRGEDRVFVLGIALSDHSFLTVGEDAYRLVEVDEAIVAAFGWGSAIMLLLAAIGGSLLSMGFLRQVDAINRTTKAIIDGRLADRVPLRGTDDELDRMARNLNLMMDRVQILMEDLQQVSGDIAHDLRTPLSRLRQRLETALGDARSIADYEAATIAALADIDSILGVFAALLRIAEVESGARSGAFADFDLSQTCRHLAETYAPVVEGNGQVLIDDLAPGIAVRGDRDLIVQMIVNLIENAMRYAPAGTTIEFSLRRETHGPLIVIADSGPGIPPEAHEKVFRRFFRLEPARSMPGTGLGLALVKAIADTHGIGIELADNRPGLKVRLRFP